MTTCTAFEGPRKITSGHYRDVALLVKKVLDRGERAPVLIFDDSTGEQIDFDLRGSETQIAERLPPPPEEAGPRKAGRPALGVVAKEVTLLPRHWDWLKSQPGGASVALRKLVDEARKVHAGRDRIRQAQEAAYRFMSAMAGNEPGFEEANRALFARNRARLEEMSAPWPIDVRDHVRRLAAAAFEEPDQRPK